MFIKLKDGRKLNLLYLSDCFVGKHDPTKVIYYLVNGTKLIDECSSPEEADAIVKQVADDTEAVKGGGIIQKDTFSDFPSEGNKNFLYVDKSTGITYYWDDVSKTYIATGTAGRTGIYSYNEALEGVIGDVVQLDKSTLTALLEPSSEYQEGSEVIGINGVHGVITGTNGNTVQVKITTLQTVESFRVVPTVNDIPQYDGRDILYYVEDVEEFRVWNEDLGIYINPVNSVLFEDVDVTEAKLDTLYVVGSELRYTTDNVKWTRIIMSASKYELDTDYYVDELLYLDNVLVKVLKDYKSPNVESDLVAFYRDIEKGNLEVIVEAKLPTTITYDLTNQIDGVTQTFKLDLSITPDKSLLVFYAGQLLLEGVNYTVDYTKHTLTTLFPEPPDAEEDKHLIIIVGDIESPNFVQSVLGDAGLVDNTNRRVPYIKRDNTKIDKEVTHTTDGKLVGKIDIKQKDKDVEITKTVLDTDDNSASVDKTIITSSDETVKFNVERQEDGSKKVNITSYGEVKAYQDYLKFDGEVKKFDLPENFDMTRPIMVIVNGIVLSEGSDKDYILNRTRKTIAFTLTFEADSNNILINF